MQHYYSPHAVQIVGPGANNPVPNRFAVHDRGADGDLLCHHPSSHHPALSLAATTAAVTCGNCLRAHYAG